MAQQDRSALVAVTITPVTDDDVQELIRIHTAAFESDAFSNLMLLNQSANRQQELMLQCIQQWLADTNAHIVKAVAAGGQVVGWSCLIVKKVAKEEEQTDKPAGTETATPKTDDISNQGQSPPTETSAEKPTTAPSKPRVLGKRMHEHTVEQEQKYIRGKSHVILQALATDPSQQGRGIGTQLVRFVTEKADAEQLPCWTVASPVGSNLYARAGFEELNKLEYNLAEWAPEEGEGSDSVWGPYAFRYMLRPAKDARAKHNSV